MALLGPVRLFRRAGGQLLRADPVAKRREPNATPRISRHAAASVQLPAGPSTLSTGRGPAQEFAAGLLHAYNRDPELAETMARAILRAALSGPSQDSKLVRPSG